MIPIRTNEIFKNRILNLDNPGKDLNVNKIHRANNFLLKKSTISYILDGNKFIILMWPIVVFLKRIYIYIYIYTAYIM